ncbi:MAG: hypothetical protein ABWY81_10105 [Jiangellaceae bacterium]
MSDLPEPYVYLSTIPELRTILRRAVMAFAAASRAELGPQLFVFDESDAC